MSNSADLAALIGGIRKAQPAIGASAIEALLHIAAGADHAAELESRMNLRRSTVARTVGLLAGRGSLGQRTRASRLRLIERRKHPHRRGAQLALTDEARRLLAQVGIDV
jgi:DNA-binding MarR family transcriptional regulator